MGNNLLYCSTDKTILADLTCPVKICTSFNKFSQNNDFKHSDDSMQFKDKFVNQYCKLCT